MTLLRKLSVSALAVLLVCAFTVPAFSQVNVTFRVNTATANDTLNPSHFLQMRGQHTGTFPGGENISWDNASDLVLSNDGGDYWSLTIQMSPQDTLYYKYWAGFSLDPERSISSGGWEFGFVKGPLDWDTRTFICPDTDTTLAMAYFHDDGTVEQLWRPFEVKEDTVAIWFRVNMDGLTKKQQFDPAANGPVGIRGDGGTSAGAIDWGATKVLLAREGDSGFWSGAAYIPADSLTADVKQPYKFYVENKHADGPDWESIADNREFVYSTELLTMTMDTTLAWQWFNNEPLVNEDPVDGNVVFRVNIEALEKTGLFDRTIGDSIQIRGPKGWDDATALRMDFNPVLNEYTVNTPFKRVVGDNITYKYFIKWDSSRVDPASPNYFGGLFTEAADLDNGWEEPGITGGGNREFKFEGVAQQFLAGDFDRDNQYFDSLLPEGVLTEETTVTFNINMAPAADVTTNPDFELFRLGTDSVWVELNTPPLAQTQGFASMDDARYLLLDPDGDGIYSGDAVLKAPTFIAINYILVYSTADAGTYVRNDNGPVAPGRRYYQFVPPYEVTADGPNFPTAFNFATFDWKNGGELTVEDPPDLTTISAVNSGNDLLPARFALEQNYPNPFNPSTTVKYSLAKTSDVRINVYNSLGQLVKVLVDQKQDAGSFEVTWTGRDVAGRIASSGIYFVKMTAGDFKSIKKMTLLK
ncbi:MAG: T9SS C-terminal target domain-containing protein [Calditrichaeota bacterium]|nr:MAG: T9SS C-terminal target domain-containing protein [Calditrichota bacterium]